MRSFLLKRRGLLSLQSTSDAFSEAGEVGDERVVGERACNAAAVTGEDSEASEAKM